MRTARHTLNRFNPTRVSAFYWVDWVEWVGCFGLLVLTLVTGCRPSGAGWDLDALLRAQPELTRIEGHRFGDMIPFPAFDKHRVALVVCRFASDRAITVSGDGPGWRQEWAARAIDAIEGAIDGIDLDFERAGRIPSRVSGTIRIESIFDARARGPVGLADTISDCDVSPKAEPLSGIRGELLTATIRIRRNRIDFLEQSREATAAEWVGALMHELGHALGFSGHTRDGNSILVLEQSRLRAAGRRALASKTSIDPTLNALYALPAGQRLGERSLTAASSSMLNEIRRLLETFGAIDRGSIITTSTVGDRAARIRWRLPDGSHLGVRFPRWREELRGGGEVTLVAEPNTLRRIRRHAALERPRLLADGGLDRTGSIDHGFGFFGLAQRTHNDAQSE